MNRLAFESSPYLRQHADNPVDWFPWGDEAFAEARRRDVPILLSVGYSACHWCHVMAHDSFEHPETAAIMNELFVCVKVDREERPDVDAIYMDAVQALNGHGGWPMTVFLTPEGEPFFGGTYYPRGGFEKLMLAITDVWRERREDVTNNVRALVEAIGRTALVEPAPGLPDRDFLTASTDEIVARHDAEWGGFGDAPKFPSTMNLDFLLDRVRRGVDERSVAVIIRSLDAMWSGGMYDHIGGGFARYSVDRRWLVPHFEKMLYDQALLLRVYSHAAVQLERPAYRRIAAEIVEYLCRDMSHPDGAFFSAEDADSLDASGHSHEGAFYTWTPSEVEAILGDDAVRWCEWYDVADPGNFEGRSIPNRLHDRSSLEVPDDVARLNDRLRSARARRPRPGLDSKVLTEWNAMTISSLAESGRLLDRPDWVERAVRAADFLVENLRDERGWLRVWHDEGRPPARHRATAHDLANLVDAFTRLAEATGRTIWLERALECSDLLIAEHHDRERGGFFTVAASAESLVVRQKDLMDNATPAANSMAALALSRLAALSGRDDLRDVASDTLRLIVRVASRAPSAAGNALTALALVLHPILEVAITGDRPDLVSVYFSRWRPDSVVVWGEPGTGPLWDRREPDLAYVCRNYSCRRPTGDVDEFTSLLDDREER